MNYQAIPTFVVPFRLNLFLHQYVSENKGSIFSAGVKMKGREVFILSNSRLHPVFSMNLDTKEFACLDDKYEKFVHSFKLHLEQIEETFGADFYNILHGLRSKFKDL